MLADGPAAEALTDGPSLAHAAVELPQMVRLATELGMATRPLTVDAFVDALADERGA